MELFGCEGCFKISVVSITKAILIKRAGYKSRLVEPVPPHQGPHTMYLALAFPFDPHPKNSLCFAEIC